MNKNENTNKLLKVFQNLFHIFSVGEVAELKKESNCSLVLADSTNCSSVSKNTGYGFLLG